MWRARGRGGKKSKRECLGGNLSGSIQVERWSDFFVSQFGKLISDRLWYCEPHVCLRCGLTGLLAATVGNLSGWWARPVCPPTPPPSLQSSSPHLVQHLVHQSVHFLSTTLPILCDHFIFLPWIILFCCIGPGVLRPHLGQSRTINIIITPPPPHTWYYQTYLRLQYMLYPLYRRYIFEALNAVDGMPEYRIHCAISAVHN